MSGNEEIKVSINDFNELIELIQGENKKNEERFQGFVTELGKTNSEHEKRYQEFYRITRTVLKDLKKALNDHELRIIDIEAKIEVIQAIIK